MCAKKIAFLVLMTCPFWLQAQLIYHKSAIKSAYVLADEKAALRKQKIIQQANDLQNLPLGSSAETSAPLESGLWAVSQFMVRTPQSDSGVKRLVKNYEQLAPSVQRALLEVLYGLYPTEFLPAIRSIAVQSTHPKNFAMAAAYWFRAQPTPEVRVRLESLMEQLTCNEGQVVLLKNLRSFMATYGQQSVLPSMDSLLAHQKVHGYKMVYSFQRKNRNYAGLAVVQNADGSLMRDSSGRLRSFVQLARSASNLPWFITNGSTPQGLFTITGTAVSKNVFIGPTPNLQMAMMNEVNTAKFSHYFPPVFNAAPERLYRAYFPASWHQWLGMMEAFDAGKIGRTEIIAHGTTISPDWFLGKPFYPISPTLGCLCGREIWDATTGQIEQSDQLDLVNAFIETKGTQGYVLVINIDDGEGPVTNAELEALLKRW
ncbi:MAG: hypothetical protein EAY75_09115 [Bacteroidetes bacterium]|nr:MAG: hypothetical protein EAY75_09115 [Bacteroidota bacterium]